MPPKMHLLSHARRSLIRISNYYSSLEDAYYDSDLFVILKAVEYVLCKRWNVVLFSCGHNYTCPCRSLQVLLNRWGWVGFGMETDI